MQALTLLQALQRLRPFGKISEELHLYRTEKNFRGPEAQAYLQDGLRSYLFTHRNLPRLECGISGWRPSYLRHVSVGQRRSSKRKKARAEARAFRMFSVRYQVRQPPDAGIMG